MKEKNSVNGLKRKVNVLTHMSRMFTDESDFGQEMISGIYLPPCPHAALSWLILYQALLAGSIRADTALGTHPSPSAIS